jgi:hypothetical protein
MGSSTKNESKMMPNVAFVRIVAQLDEILSGAPRHAHYFSILDPQLTVSLKKLKAELARPVGEYMAVHVTLNGIRGILAPIAAMGLFLWLQRHGIGTANVFLVCVVVNAIGVLGFMHMGRKLKASEAAAPPIADAPNGPIAARAGPTTQIEADSDRPLVRSGGRGA